jgi:virginiamycin B lyase
MAAGPDGALWFTVFPPGPVTIGRITTDGLVSYFPIFSGTRSLGIPFGITAGPDGALWFTDSGTNSIGRITVPLTQSATLATSTATGTPTFCGRTPAERSTSGR